MGDTRCLTRGQAHRQVTVLVICKVAVGCAEISDGGSVGLGVATTVDKARAVRMRAKASAGGSPPARGLTLGLASGSSARVEVSPVASEVA